MNATLKANLLGVVVTGAAIFGVHVTPEVQTLIMELLTVGGLIINIFLSTRSA